MQSFLFQAWLNSLCLYKFYICAQILCIHFWSLNRAQTLNDLSQYSINSSTFLVLGNCRTPRGTKHMHHGWRCALRDAICVGYVNVPTSPELYRGSCPHLTIEKPSNWSKSLLSWTQNHLPEQNTLHWWNLVHTGFPCGLGDWSGIPKQSPVNKLDRKVGSRKMANSTRSEAFRFRASICCIS